MSSSYCCLSVEKHMRSPQTPMPLACLKSGERECLAGGGEEYRFLNYADFNKGGQTQSVF